MFAASVPPLPKIIPASLWTRKDLKEFKNGLRKSKENVITIASLATATVSVYQLFWFLAIYMYSLHTINFVVYFLVWMLHIVMNLHKTLIICTVLGTVFEKHSMCSCIHIIL